MIYVATIEIPNHRKWGSVHQVEVILPSQVRHVRAFWSNVTLPTTSVLSKCIAASKGSLKQTAYGDRSVQIGSLSATLNNTHVVADSTPLCVLSKANKGTINMVRTTLPQGGMDVENGSALRIIIEEKLFEPFEHDDERLTLDDTCEALDYLSLTTEGKPKNISTNGYTAKFYMEYDK